MIHRTRQVALALLLIGSICAAQAQDTQPTSSPHTNATTKPVAAASAPAADQAVMKILNDLELSGQRYTTIRTDVRMKVVDRLTADSEERTGWIAYHKPSKSKQSKFRIHFETRKLGNGPVTREKEDWAFDGHWLTNTKHRIKDMVRYQVVPEGESAEPMRLGKGPFLLPFGQKTADVLKYYTATTRPLRQTEPEGTTYLKLTTRRERYKEVELISAEMWIDPKTNIPVKLVTRDKKKKTTTVIFNNMQTDVKLDAERMFHMPKPAGYTYKVEPLTK